MYRGAVRPLRTSWLNVGKAKLLTLPKTSNSQPSAASRLFKAIRLSRQRTAPPKKHATALTSCFASVYFPSQTRTRTVVGRFSTIPRESQLRFAGSGPHSPPRWSDARAPMRMFPALRKMRAMPETMSGRSTTPSLETLRNLLPLRSLLTQPLAHTSSCVLANHLKIARNCLVSQSSLKEIDSESFRTEKSLRIWSCPTDKEYNNHRGNRPSEKPRNNAHWRPHLIIGKNDWII